MKVTVNYLGQIRQLVGKDSEPRSADDDDGLDTLIGDLARDHGPSFAEMVLDAGGRIQPFLLVLVNGAAIDKSTPPALNEGDEVTLMPPLAGG